MSAIAEKIALAIRSETLDTFIETLTRLGVVTLSANAAGMRPHIFYTRRKLDPQFERRWAEAKSVADEEVIKEVRRRAIDGTEETVYYQGVSCGKKKIHSNSLLAMLAKASTPEYHDQSKVVLSTPEEEKEETQFDDMTEEQLRSFVALAEELGVSTDTAD